MLATVFGDVHDIGKNLVNTILTNNGYTVYDLGKQVPMNTILEKAVEVRGRRDRPLGAAGLDLEADAGLRAGAGRARPRVPGHHRRRRDQPRFRPAHRASSTTASATSIPGVFYAKDAFEGLEIMDSLTGDPRPARSVRRSERARRPKRARERDRRERRAAPATAGRRARRSQSPTFRARRSSGARTSTTSTCANSGRASISRASTGSRGAAPTSKARRGSALCARSSSRGSSAFKRRPKRERLLEPRVVYGYFPAAGVRRRRDPLRSGRPARARSRASAFARQAGGEHLSLADYLREPVDGARERRRRAAGRDRRRDVSRAHRSAASRRRLQRVVLPARLLRAVGRGARRWTHDRVRRELGLPDGPRQALLVGLRRVSGSLAARARVALARRRERASAPSSPRRSRSFPSSRRPRSSSTTRRRRTLTPAPSRATRRVRRTVPRRQ